MSQRPAVEVAAGIAQLGIDKFWKIFPDLNWGVGFNKPLNSGIPTPSLTLNARSRRRDLAAEEAPGSQLPRDWHLRLPFLFKPD